MFLFLDNVKNYMTETEKGYHCPAGCGPCLTTRCPFYNSMCIIFSVAGRKKAERWRKEHYSELMEYLKREKENGCNRK